MPFHEAGADVTVDLHSNPACQNLARPVSSARVKSYPLNHDVSIQLLPLEPQKGGKTITQVCNAGMRQQCMRCARGA
jgi:hypothetical protein